MRQFVEEEEDREMEGAPINPYYNLRVPAGKKACGRLVDAEVHFMPEVPPKKSAAYERFRRFAVDFIEVHSRSWNFDALIPYMAITYVDRFLLNGKTRIPLVLDPHEEDVGVFQHPTEDTYLFLISCLTIASKLRSKNFFLSSFLSDKSLKYSVESVVEMELKICRYLGWRMLTLTPFRFVEFFVPFLNLPPGSQPPLRPVYQLIVKSQADIAFTEIRPSALAASATLAVTSKMFPHQHKVFEMHIIGSEFINPQLNMVFKCNKMLEPLNKDPSMPTETKPAEPRAGPAESSSSVVRKRGEEKRIHRPGKEPATSEVEIQPVRADVHELMNFELCWKEAQADTDKSAKALVKKEADFRNYIRRRTLGCSGSSPRCCNIL